jgi:hypothetical protein
MSISSGGAPKHKTETTHSSELEGSREKQAGLAPGRPGEGVWVYAVPLVPECLAGLQCVLNSFLRFLLATQRFESFALEVEDVLLAHGRAGCDISAA